MRYECAADQVYWKVMAQVVAMTTTENQAAADARVPELLRCPALHFGVSAEPLVGPLDLTPWLGNGCKANIWMHGPIGCSNEAHYRRGLGWVIAGGWSGPAATPSHPQWFRSLRAQAAAAGVPFQFKQWGEWAPVGWCHFDSPAPGNVLVTLDGTVLSQHPRLISGFPLQECIMEMRRVGKREAGRLLDGVEHNGAPVVGR